MLKLNMLNKMINECCTVGIFVQSCEVLVKQGSVNNEIINDA